MKKIFNIQSEVEGAFVDLKGERYYKISHVDQMSPFFISVVSASDHWLFISSTGSLSAGRIRPENALFPYKSVDHIHENSENTGSKSIFRITENDSLLLWEPFNTHQNNLYDIERHLYKNAIGDKIVFEEINHSLKLNYQYSWHTCEQFGFVRNVELSDFSGTERNIELIDGLQNVLPSGAPLGVLQTASALVDAYKWNEQLAGSSLALFSMYAKLSDRAEPSESLLATTVFSLDSEPHSDDKILLSSQQLSRFRNGGDIHHEGLTKGVRGSYLLHKTITLKADQTRGWAIVADIDKNHADICDLQHLLLTPIKLAKLVTKSVAHNQQELIKLMSGADAWQLTAEENTSVHHYANVLFNNMRGGVFANGYLLEKSDVVKSLFNANKLVMREHAEFIDALEDNLSHTQLIQHAKATDDQQLVRLSYEYLPLTFGRRHGDPSRPWNHYEIKLKDENGDRLLSYQGNWRDIFQNWEASALSYPGFITSFIAKFVNASTVDGYNPYRITKEGVDWEKLEENDPWSNIGYWGDHQIIYLLKFLELADKFSQQDLITLLDSDIFSYANVPYQLCGVDKLFENPKDTVDFNHKTQQLTEQRVDLLGSDGRLVLDADNNVYMVNLTEKILVPLLAKLSNLVLDGGIWLNTQRPEWNDANNAIVGNGLSMVTLYYMRRYVAFMQKILIKAANSFAISKEVVDWMVAITVVLNDAVQVVKQKNISAEHSHQVLTDLANCAASYREKVYTNHGFSGKTKVQSSEITTLLSVSLSLLDATIANNLREDGLYNAYNILSYSDKSLTVEALYPMLEGQVAVLSAGILSPKQAVSLLDKLFASEMYREDQASFMLYPDRELTTFMNKNRLTAKQVQQNSLLTLMMEADDKRIVMQDSDGNYHFNADFENSGYLRTTLDKVMIDYPAISHDQVLDVEKLYEQVFNHKAFTGRSGTMFGYEGLGSIYWHMVSKLLLAVQENYHASRNLDATSKETLKLGDYYYRVRAGIGFNKTPQNYGAFPTDPYSHTPKHSGAQQPGMTGQVKEEVITRFGELGIQINDGQISINPSLLKPSEFLKEAATFTYLDLLGGKQRIHVLQNQLVFTYCQVPFVYKICEQGTQNIVLHFNDGLQQTINTLHISSSLSEMLFSRSGKVNKIVVTIPKSMLRVGN
ncbi:hypothetical protein GCM10007916_31400 [Psychromonas marina]|uniref:Glycosyl hydrolase 36 catalytic domain-containing protein n=1 Tax=Psychromonas marina TaxID=88364 RepID=A0ABQ6E4G7_9GAMM|nr:hypothetical protein [Psychromonas marina]GLS92070.1 hypothetical protein GCM10007916_31400 [Psychromonas marina]